MTEPQTSRELPTEPLGCRQLAERTLREGHTTEAIAWGLLAICGHLAELVRQQRRR